MINREEFQQLLSHKVLFIDGAMGTLLDSAGLTADDYDGHDGCPEILNITKPDLIESIHGKYLEAGANIIETNTFGANRLTLKEYGLEERAYELNLEGARRAGKAVKLWGDKENDRLIGGSIGPGSRIPSLGHVTPDEIYNAYDPQVRGLIDGGADLLIIETAQDLLHVKTLIRLILEMSNETEREIPLIVSVTIESNGAMLTGSDIPAVVTALSPYPLSALGLNCATGPEKMRSHLRLLTELSPFPVFAMPNAGLPVHKNGHFVYELSPGDMAEQVKRFEGCSIVGGCCGSTPEHIREIVKKTGIVSSVQGGGQSLDVAVSSLFRHQAVRVEPAPLLIGERSNATGSRAFKNALLREDWDTMISIVNQQDSEGAHVADVSLSVVGRDEKKDMAHFIHRLNKECRLPLQIDTTDPGVMETALKRCAGRSVVNSVNLEKGEDAFLTIAELCKKYGAMLICLTIDEKGMARTKEQKIRIAKRMIRLAEQAGLRQDDLFIDTLTFTLGSGDDEERNSAVETLNAVKYLSKHYPRIHLVLGVSNVSFGLKPHLRHFLNSVMLYEAVRAGLHAAIIHPAKIRPLTDIPESVRMLCRTLIYNEQSQGDPLLTLMREAEETVSADEKEDTTQKTPEEKLRWSLFHGDSADLERILENLQKKIKPLSIINDILLPGMNEIGDLFGEGKMQLPFVLKSASVMKKAVDLLKPFMDTSDAPVRGTVVLATVRGDVHDIGKNLVDVVLSNNGFVVHNIGIKQTPEAILNAVETINPDVLGLSGLLVRSTIEMKNTLIILQENKIRLPVLLGGAALTEDFVRDELQPVYSGPVYYAKDAFHGLTVIDQMKDNDNKSTSPKKIKETKPEKTSDKKRRTNGEIKPYQYPEPPFSGTCIRNSVDVQKLKSFVNQKTLFTFQWQLRKGSLSELEYEDYLAKEGAGRFEEMMNNEEIVSSLNPQVVYGYFSARREEKNSLLIRNSETKDSIKMVFPRQKRGDCLSVADYVSPDSDGLLPIQLVTMGESAITYSRRLYETDDYAEYFFYHGLVMQLTEALAEENHGRILYELGLEEYPLKTYRKPRQYQGIRISPGYPMAPELSVQKDILNLLSASRIGVTLSSGYQLIPECSTTALILLHPEAKYFNI